MIPRGESLALLRAMCDAEAAGPVTYSTVERLAKALGSKPWQRIAQLRASGWVTLSDGAYMVNLDKLAALEVVMQKATGVEFKRSPSQG